MHFGRPGGVLMFFLAGVSDLAPVCAVLLSWARGDEGAEGV